MTTRPHAHLHRNSLTVAGIFGLGVIYFALPIVHVLADEPASEVSPRHCAAKVASEGTVAGSV